MSYNVLSIPPFDKQLKRLAKKFSSLKKDFSQLIESLEQNPKQGTPPGNDCYKYVWLLLQREKVKVATQELLPILLLRKIPSFYSPFTINLRGKTYQIKNN